MTVYTNSGSGFQPSEAEARARALKFAKDITNQFRLFAVFVVLWPIVLVTLYFTSGIVSLTLAISSLLAFAVSIFFNPIFRNYKCWWRLWKPHFVALREEKDFEEMKHFCRDTFDPHSYVIDAGMVVLFRRNADAVMFKLRWG